MLVCMQCLLDFRPSSRLHSRFGHQDGLGFMWTGFLLSWDTFQSCIPRTKKTCLDLLIPQLSSHQAHQLVFSWKAAPLVSLIVLSLLIREKLRGAIGEHYYSEHSLEREVQGWPPFMENRWVDWGCHNKEILQGKKKKKKIILGQACEVY